MIVVRLNLFGLQGAGASVFASELGALLPGPVADGGCVYRFGFNVSR